MAARDALDVEVGVQIPVPQLPKSIAEIQAMLAEIDKAVEPIAVERAGDRDLKLIVYAIHSLVGCMDDLAEHLSARGG